MRNPDLSVVVPTRNERENIVSLFEALHAALHGVATEVIIVDDSDDETPAIVQRMAEAYEAGAERFHVRLHHRATRHERLGGLATAVSLGMRLASATYIAVIDADLQHPPARLRTLFDEAVRMDADVALATRYRRGGGYAGLDGVSRKLISVGLKWVAKTIFPDQLLRVSDPLGGFFLVRRSLIEGVTLRPIGYKISLELLIRTHWVRLVEVPYHFQARVAGQSKSDFKQGVMVLRHMARLVREVPAAARFWKFLAVGASGVAVNLALFALFLSLHWSPLLAAGGALEASILGNFLLNAVLTWGDLHSRPRGWVGRAVIYHGAVAPVIALYLGIFVSLARLHSPTTVDQIVSLLPALALSYWLARRVVFAPRDSWASLFHRTQRVLTVQEAIAAGEHGANVPAPDAMPIACDPASLDAATGTQRIGI